MSGFFSNICGGKNDVNHTPKNGGDNHKTVRASKFLGVNDNLQNGITGKQFQPIRTTNVGNY